MIRNKELFLIKSKKQHIHWVFPKESEIMEVVSWECGWFSLIKCIFHIWTHHELTCGLTWIQPMGILLSKALIQIHMNNSP